jgi:hypothetical protein
MKLCRWVRDTDVSKKCSSFILKTPKAKAKVSLNVRYHYAGTQCYIQKHRGFFSEILSESFNKCNFRTVGQQECTSCLNVSGPPQVFVIYDMI